MHLKFIDLYDRYFDDIYRYTYFKTGNKWETDDLVSEIFTKAYENFSSAKGSYKAWLFTIARNAITDHYRKKKEVVLGDDMDLYTYPHTFEEDLEKDEELKCLKSSLKMLSGDEREIISLRYFSDMKYGDIGKVLGKSEDAVKMKAFRTIKKLKTLVNNFMEGKK